MVLADELGELVDLLLELLVPLLELLDALRLLLGLLSELLIAVIKRLNCIREDGGVLAVPDTGKIPFIIGSKQRLGVIPPLCDEPEILLRMPLILPAHVPVVRHRPQLPDGLQPELQVRNVRLVLSQRCGVGVAVPVPVQEPVATAVRPAVILQRSHILQPIPTKIKVPVRELYGVEEAVNSRTTPTLFK